MSGDTAEDYELDGNLDPGYCERKTANAEKAATRCSRAWFCSQCEFECNEAGYQCSSPTQLLLERCQEGWTCVRCESDCNELGFTCPPLGPGLSAPAPGTQCPIFEDEVRDREPLHPHNAAYPHPPPPDPHTPPSTLPHHIAPLTLASRRHDAAAHRGTGRRWLREFRRELSHRVHRACCLSLHVRSERNRGRNE